MGPVSANIPVSTAYRGKFIGSISINASSVLNPVSAGLFSLSGRSKVTTGSSTGSKSSPSEGSRRSEGRS